MDGISEMVDVRW